MRILFTGGSSFTGHWFLQELVAAGHQVTAVFRNPAESYDGVRRRRVEESSKLVDARFGVAFGDPAFRALVAGAPSWDVLCHHAADVTDYKSERFDVAAALANNTRELDAVLAGLREKGCRRVVLTGSVFEPGEGRGSEDLRAFSPYGLSKAFTAETFRYFASRQELRLGKFVIPNPFGPLEEPRFTAHLMRCWFAKNPAGVNTPAYVRDNIHVSLLARAYVRFVESLGSEVGFAKTNPSGYVETQGDFALRFAKQMRARLGLPCEVELAEQTEFPEPLVRTNTDPVDGACLGWSESEAWDGIADYYRTLHG
jgi:nucleoside-diphosphate-sugar epimerase